MSVWILKGFFDTISKSLRGAAYIDRGSKGRTLIQVILPLVKPGNPGSGAVFLPDFWEDFLWGPDPGQARPGCAPFASGIAMTYLGEYNYDWGRVMAAAVGAAIPIPDHLHLFAEIHDSRPYRRGGQGIGCLKNGTVV